MTFWLALALSNTLVATALAAAAWIVSRRARPQWALVAWLLVLAKLLTPPLVDLPLPSLRPIADVQPAIVQRVVVCDDTICTTSTTTSETGNSAGTFSTGISWQSFGGACESWHLESCLLAIWLCGTGGYWLLASVRIARFCRTLDRVPLAHRDLQGEIARLAAHMGMPRVPAVRVVTGRVPPLAWAMVGRATVVLPGELIARMGSEERETLLVHELAHFARRDHLIRWFELVVVGLYWWHPVAWWARRRLNEAEEACCDARVLTELPHAASAYARAMLATVEFLGQDARSVPLGASGFSQAHTLERRLKMILDGSSATRTWWRRHTAMTLVALAALPLSVRALWAEPPIESLGVTEAPASHESQPKRNDDSESSESSNEFGQAARARLETIKNETLRGIATVRYVSARLEAATRQLQAVTAAYEADTVTLDQLLEAQRRFAQTQIDNVTAVGDLCADRTERDLLTSEACLDVSNEALEQARVLWKKIYKRMAGDGNSPSEARDEAQAREQYFHFKTQTQVHLRSYFEARKAAGMPVDSGTD